MEASTSARALAVSARDASRQLQALPTAERVAMLHRVADALLEREAEILEANASDVQEATGKVAEALLQRLALKPQKIQQLADGIRAIAAQVWSCTIAAPYGTMCREAALQRPQQQGGAGACRTQPHCWYHQWFIHGAALTYRALPCVQSAQLGGAGGIVPCQQRGSRC